MRRVLLILIFLAAATALTGCIVTEANPEVVVDGRVLDFSVKPEVLEGIVMVPGHEIIRVLYGEPLWDEETKTLGIQNDNMLFLVQAGNKTANINDSAHEMKVAPSMKDSQLMVPLELVVEVLGYRINWSELNATIWTDRAQVSVSDVERLLVGLWSSSDYYGEIYDPGTGAPVGSAYNGEWYLFREDGSFRYVIVGSGFAISGALVQEGKYRVEGSNVVLHSIKASWYPDPGRANQKPGYENQAADDETVPLLISSSAKIKLDDDTFYYHGD